MHDKQSRGFDQSLGKVHRRLSELAERLARGKTRHGRDAAARDIDTILRPRWVGEVVTTTLTGHTQAELRLTWRVDSRARTRLQRRLFGKRILFTNRDTWPIADIVAGNRSQSEVDPASGK